MILPIIIASSVKQAARMHDQHTGGDVWQGYGFLIKALIGECITALFRLCVLVLLVQGIAYKAG
jgi:hypothetical protein